MKKLRYLLLLLVYITGSPLTTMAGDVPSSDPQPKYIFLFIGDGMGLAHVSMAEALLAERQGKTGIQKLNMSTFPVMTFATTFAKNRYITCSAAAGTALATGEKTSINTIGMDSARIHPLQTIAERAKAKGMKVGIMTTVSIDHATPACFYAHQPDRNRYYEIGTQLLASGFDFFGGGGFKYPTGKKKDRADLYHAVAEQGYTVVKEQKTFDTISAKSLPMMVVNPVLSASSDMPYAMDSIQGSFSLSGIVKKAIEVLDNPKGFFMMVEGGKIDWAAHANDAAAIVGEVFELDKAVGYALEFYRKHPDETLIIVTADHETGGLSLGWAGTSYESDFTLLDRQKVSGEVFDAKIEAYKKRTPASMVRYDSVMRMIATDFGLGTDIKLSKYEEEQLRRAFRISISGEKESLYKDENTVLYDNYDPIGITARKILANKAGIDFTTWMHTGTPVPVRVIGSGQELFNGFLDNTDIPVNIIRLLRLQAIKQ